jgi:hypothetical protein
MTAMENVQRATSGEANIDKTAERNARLRRMGFQPGKTGRQIPNRVLELYDSFAPEFGGGAMSQATRAELMMAATNLQSRADQRCSHGVEGRQQRSAHSRKSSPSHEACATAVARNAQQPAAKPLTA